MLQAEPALHEKSETFNCKRKDRGLLALLRSRMPEIEDRKGESPTPARINAVMAHFALHAWRTKPRAHAYVVHIYHTSTAVQKPVAHNYGVLWQRRACMSEMPQGYLTSLTQTSRGTS